MIILSNDQLLASGFVKIFMCIAQIIFKYDFYFLDIQHYYSSQQTVLQTVVSPVSNK